MSLTETRPLRVMLVAAEASGDAIGAGLARALRARLGEAVEFVGVGGAQMAAEGVDSPFDITELSILGLFEGLMAYPRVVRRANQTARLALETKPDVAVLIDSWGFTLRVARRLRRDFPHMPIIKYVGPQVWASRPGRAKTLAGAVDLLLTPYAFEAPYFEREGLQTVVVGSSALARDFSGADPERCRMRIGAKKGDLILLVLPGSRPAEIDRLIVPFVKAAGRLMGSPKLKVVMPMASTVVDQIRAHSSNWRAPMVLLEDEAGKADAMLAADFAIACSGTVTTELAVIGCPMVVGYRLGKMTHRVLKRLIRTPYITLLNVAAGAMVVPEFIQDACTDEALATEVARLLDDPEARAEQIAAQTAALEKLGPRGGDPAGRAADAVLLHLKNKGVL